MGAATEGRPYIYPGVHQYLGVNLGVALRGHPIVDLVQAH